MKKYKNKIDGSVVGAVRVLKDNYSVINLWVNSLDSVKYFSVYTPYYLGITIFFNNDNSLKVPYKDYLVENPDGRLESVCFEDFERDYQLYSEYATEFFKSTGIPAWYIEPYKDENLNKIPENTPIALENKLPPFGEKVIVFTENGTIFMNELKNSVTTVSEEGEEVVYIWYKPVNGYNYKYWLPIPCTGDFFNKDKNCKS